MATVSLGPDEVTKAVFDLYRKYGADDYLGEEVTQEGHALQCAQWAETEDGRVETVLGAFLHDVGHLVAQDRGLDRMVTGDVTLGARDHDVVGEAFLREFGVPQGVTQYCRGHVDAKRYLTHKYKEHYEKLTEASKMTLEHQGGPMSAEEAKEFETNPNIESILRMRVWDERAKDPNVETPPIEKYQAMFREYIARNCQDNI